MRLLRVLSQKSSRIKLRRTPKYFFNEKLQENLSNESSSNLNSSFESLRQQKVSLLQMPITEEQLNTQSKLDHIV